MAVIGFRDGLATLLETAPGISVAQVVEATEASLTMSERIPEMKL
jgi:acetate CoA/acetoacetate CoA-transferase beta subunit